MSLDVDVSDEQPLTTKTISSRKPIKRSLIIVSCILAIGVIAGIGFTVWHEQPSFCNAICHSPMDRYVTDYYADDSSCLIVTHANEDVTCLECHETNLGEQISEGLKWISKDYNDPLSKRNFGTKDFCYRCHDDGDASTGLDWSDIVAATSEWDKGATQAVNPHDNHMRNPDCSECHSIHSTSKLVCNQCHTWKIPEGWAEK